MILKTLINNLQSLLFDSIPGKTKLSIFINWTIVDMPSIINNIDNMLTGYFTTKELSEYKKIINNERLVKKQFQKIKDDSKLLYNDWYYYLAKIDLLIAFAKKKLKRNTFLQMILHLGNLALISGNYEEAEKLLLYLVTDAKGASLPQSLQADVYLNLADLYSRYAYWQKSLKCAATARKIFAKRKNSVGIVKCDNLIGVINAEKGNLESAKARFEKALVQVIPENNDYLIAELENNTANISTIQGNFDTAIVYYKKALKTMEKIGDMAQVATVTHNLGMTYTLKEDNETALYHFNKSIKLSIKSGNLSILVVTYFQKAYVLIKLKNFTKADYCLKKSIDLCNHLNDQLSFAEVYKIKGIMERELKNYPAAESYLLMSMRINREFENELNLAETSYELGLLYNITGRDAESKKIFFSAYKLFEKKSVSFMVKKIKALLDLNSLIISLKTKRLNILILSTSSIMVEGMRSFIEQHIFAENVNVFNCPGNCENILKSISPECLDCSVFVPVKKETEKGAETIFLIDDNELSSAGIKFQSIGANYKTIIYTNNNNALYLQYLMNKGINGVVHKASSKMNLLTAIESVISGSVYIDPLWKHKTSEPASPYQSASIIDNNVLISLGGNGSVTCLSKREKELFKLIAEGKKNKEIADILCISSSTVETHKANILKKLNLLSTNDLTIFAAKCKDKIHI